MDDFTFTKCARKIRHASRSAAEIVAKKIGATAYRCHHCAGWHVGSPTGHDLKAAFTGARRRKGR
jgi:hypothetical protein